MWERTDRNARTQQKLVNRAKQKGAKCKVDQSVWGPEQITKWNITRKERKQRIVKVLKLQLGNYRQL